MKYSTTGFIGALIIALSLYSTGCTKQQGMDSAESAATKTADTATPDNAGDVVELLPMDAVPDPHTPVAEADLPQEVPAVVPVPETPATPEIVTPIAEQPVAPAPQTPARTPAAVADDSELTNYKVRSGDTLMKIAFEVYGDIAMWKRIHEINRSQLKNPNAIAPGAVIKFEKPASEFVQEKNGESFYIKSGDTLGTISKDVYGTNKKWKKLWDNNRQLIKDPNKIYAGFYLYYQMTEAEKRLAEAAKSKAEPTETASSTSVTTEVQNRMPASMKPSVPEVKKAEAPKNLGGLEALTK